MSKSLEFRFENRLGLKELAKEHPAAVSRALNRTMNSGRTELSRIVREEYNIKKSDFEQGVEVRASTRNRLAAFIVVRGRRFGIGMFAARRLKGNQTVSVSIKKGQRKTVGGFFVWGRGSAGESRGRAIVYHRTGVGRKNIAEMFTISAAEMAGTKAIEAKVREKINERMLIEMDHQLSVELAGIVPASAARGWKNGGHL